jgi:RNA recognition motif-containing protein
MRAQNFRGNVFVANLPPEISDEQLAEAFDAFGIVLSATVAHDPATGKRLRYGFVDIATERAAKLAVESMNGAAIDGYNLDVRISERPVTAKKPRAASVPQHSVPQRSPRRVMPHPGASNDGGDDERPGTFTPRPQPRRQPTFQVERRSLPRRSG